ncbi:ABC transporter substrate-binding protein [Thermopolyspora sp. NPDC052614]|uniref:ABC transporter substrate-binding protein n=1 Tax=Thermopolyspora sp. NPDC052614 TaxID=3155682 RepID=UPI003414F252
MTPPPYSRRQLLRGGALAFAALAAAACAPGSGTSTGGAGGGGSAGPVTIEMWHGQSDFALEAIKKLVADFEKSHPTIKVDISGGVVADAMLQKVTAALASDSPPDIAYIFGSDLPNVARSPRVADLTDMVNSGPTPWQDYWQSVRDVVTIKGRVRAMPALVDSLAVVCNKKLFEEAKIPLPQAGWTWDDFVETARELTDPKRKVFGTGWPGAGDEDTVWRIWPLVWDLGGDVVGADGRSNGFAGVGAQALQVVERLAKDGSVYIDPKPGSEQMYQVFLSGRMGMVPTGPWQLPDVIDAKIDYHVVPLPSFSGRPVTIAGPDTWTVFDNGPDRLKAAQTLVTWLTQPAQDVRWDVDAGSLPLSKGTQALPEWTEHAEKTEGLATFVTALQSARGRPANPAYPQVSTAVGEAIVAVLLGRSTPADAIAAATTKADAALRVPN